MCKKILILIIIIIALFILNKILSYKIYLKENFLTLEEENAINDYRSYFNITTIQADLNGKWTTPVTKINNNTVQNPLIINITGPATGTITVPRIIGSPIYDGTVYNILYVSPDIVKATNGSKELNVETCDDICPTMDNDMLTRVISIIVGGSINIQFMSVNIKNTVTLTQTDLTNINNFTFPTTLANTNLISTYDTEYYYKILESYVFPSNTVTFKNTINAIVKSDISTKLYNRLYISIARCFQTVTQNIIQTVISPPTLYTIKNNILPDNITIQPQSNDLSANSSINFGAFSYVATNIFIFIPTVKYQYTIPNTRNAITDPSNLIFIQGNTYPDLTSTTKNYIFNYVPYLYKTIETNDINKTIQFQVTSLPSN